MRLPLPQSIFAVFAAPILFFATSASAAPSADSCGNIALMATGECHLEVSGGCQAKCTPLTLQAACDGQCNGTIDASCSGSCNAECVADCTAHGGSLDCNGACTADCNANCDGQCAADGNQANCSSYCKASCKSNCQVNCKATQPAVDCKGKCNASCEGSCTAQADFDCSYKCSADLQGGCTTACQEPNGALFCTDQNGVDQFVHVNNLEECEAYLSSNYDVKFEASASANASISCTTNPVGSAPLNVGVIATMVVGLGFAVSRRRRR